MFHCTGAQRSLTLTSSVPFSVIPPPTLCPGSTVQFNCIAVDFTGIDWDRNGDQFQQYTATSQNINQTEEPRQGLFVILNSRVVNSAISIDYNSTLTATVEEGVASGDVITCGNSLQNATSITVNYSAVRKSLLYSGVSMCRTWHLASYPGSSWC